MLNTHAKFMLHAVHVSENCENSGDLKPLERIALHKCSWEVNVQIPMGTTEGLGALLCQTRARQPQLDRYQRQAQTVGTTATRKTSQTPTLLQSLDGQNQIIVSVPQAYF